MDPWRADDDLVGPWKGKWKGKLVTLADALPLREPDACVCVFVLYVRAVRREEWRDGAMRERPERLETRCIIDCVGVMGDQIIDCVRSDRGEAIGLSQAGKSLVSAIPGGEDVFRVENDGDSEPDGMQTSIAGADVFLAGVGRSGDPLSRLASMPRCVSTAS